MTNRSQVIGWKYPPQAWWPELPGKSGTYSPIKPTWSARLCRGCGKTAVAKGKRYCGKCAGIQQLESKRKSARQKRNQM